MNGHGETDTRCALDPRLAWRAAGAEDLYGWAALIARTAADEKPVWFERRDDLEQILESKKNPAVANTVVGVD
jgi:mycothiol synthase